MAGLNYTNLSALTKDKFIPILVDNIFSSNAVLLKLLKNAEKLDGGKKIIVPVEYGKLPSSGGSATQGFITYGSSSAPTAIKDAEIISASEWEWATAYSGIYFRGDEEHKNMGDSQVLSLLKSKMKNAEKSMKDLFGTSIFSATGGTTAGLTTLNGAGTEASANYTAYDAGDLGEADHPAGILETATNPQWHAPGAVANSIVGYRRKVGNIDSYPSSSDDNKWWNSPFLSMASFSGTVTSRATFTECTDTTNGVAKLVKHMTRLYGACSIDNDSPDLIVTTQTIFDAYESSLQANKRWAGDDTLADAGFQTLRFKGATVVVDSHCPAGQMYMLNSKYLDFKVHNKRNFAFEPFRRQEGHDAMQARIFWMGQLTSTNNRMHGLMVGGPTSY